MSEQFNYSDDIAGIVESVGANMKEFKNGDRVATFHAMMAPHCSFAEYAIARAYTTFHLPRRQALKSLEPSRLPIITRELTLDPGCLGFTCSNGRGCGPLSATLSS